MKRITQRPARGLACCAVPVLLLLAMSCSAKGPGNVGRDRFDYNQVIGQSNNEQMLLNLVRTRYRDVPVFMAVSSVLTQYVYSGSASVSGFVGTANAADADSIGGTATLRYIERPTITFSPMTGPEFAEQMLTPIPVSLLFSLAAAGWPAEELLGMGLERINDVRNAPFRGTDAHSLRARSPEFKRVIQLLVELGVADALEFQAGEELGTGHLVLVNGLSDAIDADLAAFRQLLGLDPTISKYRVVQERVSRASDEITVRVRSLLALMGALSWGVDVPAAHHDASIIDEAGPAEIRLREGAPMWIRSSAQKPEGAFVSVEYLDQWFYLELSDLKSREAFGLVTYLYLMMASPTNRSDPVITVPAG